MRQFPEISGKGQVKFLSALPFPENYFSFFGISVSQTSLVLQYRIIFDYFEIQIFFVFFFLSFFVVALGLVDLFHKDERR